MEREELKKKAIKKQIFHNVIDLLNEEGCVTNEEKNRIKDMIDRKEA